MDKKLIQIYETGLNEEFEKFLDDIQLNDLFKILQQKVNRGENVANILKIIFQGSTNKDNSSLKRCLDVYKFSITLLQRLELPSDLASDLIGLLLIETDNLSSAALIEISESLINTLKTKKMPGNKWLEIIPKVLTTLTSRNVVTQENIDMTGTEYRAHLLKCLCLNKWEPECAVQLASTFREISLSNEELEWILEKLLKILQEVEIQEIPTLMYQLLLLSSKGCRKQLLEKILIYFKNHAELSNKQKENEVRSVHSIETIRHIEGTVILHITFAAKQDQEIGKEYVKLLKNNQHQPEHILSSFCIALALSIAKMQRFEEQIIDILKHIILYYFQENEKKSHSYWMREMMSVNYNLPSLILETIKTSKFGWDYVTQSLVKLGFSLLDSFGPKGAFGKIPDIGVFHTAHTSTENASALGAKILQETFKIHETVREEILQQILNRVITKTSKPVFHYIDVIAKTIQASPQKLLDILRKFREILDYLPFLPFPSAISFLRALTPLLKISSPLKDALMVVLRKALFNREIEARKVAISGFLIVLRNFRLSDGQIPGSQNSYSQSSISLSQVRIETNMSYKSGSFEALCLELLGTLRRVFTQQAEIRTLLYEGLHEVLCRNPQLSDAILELLMNQFEKYYEKDEEATPPLKLENCINTKCEELVISEPLPHLLTCIQLCVTTILQKLSEKDDDDDDDEPSSCFNFLKSSLDCLIKRIISTDFEDFDLNHSSDFSITTSVGRRNQLISNLLLGIYEALIEYMFTIGNFSTESCNMVLSLYIAYKKLQELIKEKHNNGKKEGRGKGKKTNNMTNKFPESVFTLKFISNVLKALFCDDNSDHQDGLIIIRGKHDFSQHFVNLASKRILQFQEKGKCAGICKSTEETFKCFFTIGKALYQQQKTEDNSVLSSDCLNCLVQLFTLFCNHHPHQLKSFLEFLEDSSCETNNNTLHYLILKYVKVFQNFINFSSNEDNLKIAAHYLNVISMLCKHLNHEGKNENDIWNWIKENSVEKEISETNVAKILFSLYLNLGRQDKTYVILIRDVAHVIHYELGDIDEEVEIQQSKNFALANRTTSPVLVPIIIQHMDYILEDIDWVLASIKTGLTLNSVERQNKEKSICNQFGHLISICNELVQTAIPRGSCTENAMKFLIRMYNSLSSLTKFYISMYNQKAGEICLKFEKMVRLSGTHLTPQVYSMISYIQATDDKGKKRKRHKLDYLAEKARVLHETKVIPQLIYAIEQYEHHLIQLTKKSKVNLMEHIKLATSRDFRINITTVQAALENETQSDDDSEDTENTNPEAENIENSASNSSASKSKKRKKKSQK